MTEVPADNIKSLNLKFNRTKYDTAKKAVL
jgi:hypothetical protein